MLWKLQRQLFHLISSNLVICHTSISPPFTDESFATYLHCELPELFAIATKREVRDSGASKTRLLSLQVALAGEDD